MTALAELQKTNQRMQYVLCIEGFGWPMSEGSDFGGSEDGFAGTLFVTKDIDGDMADRLTVSAPATITLRQGLILPSGIKDSLDPVLCAYSLGGMTFNIVDSDSPAFVRERMLPQRPATEDLLSAPLDHSSTTIELEDGTFSEGDEVWLGQRELVRLGTKSGAGPYEYADSIRGWLGTPRGMVGRFITPNSLCSWEVNTIVQDVAKVLFDRRVRLYGCVPGVNADDGSCVLLYCGRTRGLTGDLYGVNFTLETAGDIFSGYTRTRYSPKWEAEAKEFVDTAGNGGDPYSRVGMPADGGSTGSPPPPQAILESEVEIVDVWFKLTPTSDPADPSTVEQFGYHTAALAAFYHYRSEPGGTAGMFAAMTSSHPRDPQAPSYMEGFANQKQRIIDAYMYTNGNTLLAKHVRFFTDSNVTYDMSDIVCSPANGFGEFYLQLTEGKTEVRFLLDNTKDEYETSRFAVNREVKRNPVDAMLMFFTSFNNEFAIGDFVSGDEEELELDCDAPANDLYAGYALHCVEGDNKGYARPITGNTGATFTVSPPFPNMPSAGDEYQVRNTIYDVLPLSWGLCIPNHLIDIDEFERVRDVYLPDVQLGRFLIGNQDSVDMFKLILENVCASHGLMLFVHRTTGKLSIRYVGEAFPDGVLEDYHAIGEDDVLEISDDVDYGAGQPAGKIILAVRPAADTLVNVHRTTTGSTPISQMLNLQTSGQVARVQAPSIEGDSSTIVINPVEIESIFDESELANVEIKAMFNSIDDAQHIIAEARGRLRRYVTPPPVFSMRLSLQWIAGENPIQPGSFLSLTHSAIWDPYTSERGTTDRVCRVLSTRIVLEEQNPGLEVQLELLEAVNGAKIAPALLCSGAFANDANGDYIVVSAAAYVTDSVNDRDYYHFQVGDQIQLRSITGALKGSLGAITGFGDNEDADPRDAVETGSSSVRIYFNGAPLVFAVGDYITLDDYDGTITARMTEYAAWAGPSGGLTGGDDAKVYGT